MTPLASTAALPRVRGVAFDGLLIALCGVILRGVILLPSTPASARMCVGSNAAMSRVGQTTQDNYNYYKNMYSGELKENCRWYSEGGRGGREGVGGRVGR